MLGTAVLSFVLLQDGYKSVLLSGVFRTAIATVGCRCYGDLQKLFSFDPLCFAVIDRNVYSIARFRICLLILTNINIHNYAGRFARHHRLAGEKVGLVNSLSRSIGQRWAAGQRCRPRPSA